MKKWQIYLLVGLGLVFFIEIIMGLRMRRQTKEISSAIPTVQKESLQKPSLRPFVLKDKDFRPMMDTQEEQKQDIEEADEKAIMSLSDITDEDIENKKKELEQLKEEGKAPEESSIMPSLERIDDLRRRGVVIY